MDNGFKTTCVAPEQHDPPVAADERRDENLTAQALGEVRGAEQLSGFGRFVTKIENLFRASEPSHGTQDSSHLKAAPILMSAGLVLLLATGLLFLVSKPESAVHSHFRQPPGLAASHTQQSATGSNAEPLVREDQLEGGQETSDRRKTNPAAQRQARRSNRRAARRFSFAHAQGVGSDVPPQPGVQNRSSELESPTTVFVADSVASSVLTPHINSQDSRQPTPRLPAGTEIAAHTTNAISSGLESPVVAIVDRNLEANDTVVIPQGARVIGYTAGAVKNRINVRFMSLVLPNNREVTISGLALTKDGSAGLVGKVQGSGHPILAGAARIGTGAAAVATEFAGQGSLNQPFSQADYLRNQLAYEAASEGSRYSNRLQQTTSVPIVTVSTNQPIRIFLLNALTLSDGRTRNRKAAQQTDTATTLTADQNPSSEQALVAAQTAYIQALEAQLADLRAALKERKSNDGN